MEYINVVGVQFRRAGRIYDFCANDLTLKIGDDVVVETERGPSLAKIAYLKFASSKNYSEVKLKPILRLASPDDVDDKRKLTPERAVAFAEEKIAKLNLKMRVLKSDVQFGGNKVIIYFSAPGRVDFRELVKELAGGLKARVELRQVGARDEAKLVGGMGICGREYCCSCHLREFIPVSIRMAKNQNLALNPSKVSGGCGRLLCCLTYENSFYVTEKQKLPQRGTKVRIEGNKIGEIIKVDIFTKAIIVELEDHTQLTVPACSIEIIESRRGPVDDDLEEEAKLKEVMDLEDNDTDSKLE